MKTNIGLNDEARFEIGQMLNLLLADEYVLSVTTRDYHWNVTGPEFHGLHQLFESHFAQLSVRLEQVAERARAIGVGARGNWADLAAAARGSADPGIGLAAEHMLAELLALHEDLVLQLRKDIPSCERLGDPGTAVFLTELLRQHEKTAWILRSQLETESDEGATRPPFFVHGQNQ